MQLLIASVGKQYRRDFWGLRDFSLELGSGVLGLLGPNGAGKSTLMRILATITQATEGKVTRNGMGRLQFSRLFLNRLQRQADETHRRAYSGDFVAEIVLGDG
jgi:ABC-type multidrug transport system ATPase subunit